MLHKKSSRPQPSNTTGFVSWSDVLHPEQAVHLFSPASSSNPSTSDDSHNTNSNTSSDDSTMIDRWGIVWAEAWVVDDNSSYSSSSSSSGGRSSGGASNTTASNLTKSSQQEDEEAARQDGMFPQVEAVHVDEPSVSQQRVAVDPLALSEPPRNNAISTPHKVITASQVWPCAKASPLELIIGSSLTVSAVATVIAMDLAGVVVYLSAIGFHQISQIFRPWPPLWLFFAIFEIIVYTLLLTDAVLLLSSVLVTESLALTAWIVCGLFGACPQAFIWHQHIRKVCHLTRWAFRGFHEGWKPHRGWWWKWENGNNDGAFHSYQVVEMEPVVHGEQSYVVATPVIAEGKV